MPLSAGARLGPYEITGGSAPAAWARSTAPATRASTERRHQGPAAGARRDPSSAPASSARREHRGAEPPAHLHAARRRAAWTAARRLPRDGDLEGETLAERLARAAAARRRCCATAPRSPTALDAAHRAGIVHRDLKPGQHDDHQGRREAGGLRPRQAEPRQRARHQPGAHA